MTPDRDDEVLRAAFAEVKAEDARARLPFDAVVARSTSRPQLTRASLVLRLAAAGIVIAASFAAYGALADRQSRFTVPNEVVALAAWRPVTDGLLAMPNDLLRSPPNVGASILDRMIGEGVDTLSLGALR